MLKISEANVNEISKAIKSISVEELAAIHTGPIPEKVWGGIVNTSGLLTQSPVELLYDPYLKGWWSVNGDLWVEKLGLDIYPNGTKTTYASMNIEEVRAFIDGAKAYRLCIHNLR